MDYKLIFGVLELFYLHLYVDIFLLKIQILQSYIKKYYRENINYLIIFRHKQNNYYLKF